MNWLKLAVTPGIASLGLIHYQRGNYRKSCRLLRRAERWGPEVVYGSTFEGVLGLSHYRLGQENEGFPYLHAARNNLTKVASHKAEIHSVECYVLDDINRVLGNIQAQ